MRKIIVLISSLFILSGCFGGGDQQVICTGTLNGSNVTSILKAAGDDVHTETYEESIDISKSGFDPKNSTETEKKEVIELMASKKYNPENIKNKKGITLQSSIDGNNFIMSMHVDYKVASLEDLKSLHFIESDSSINLGISLDKTVENYESNGLICK